MDGAESEFSQSQSEHDWDNSTYYHRYVADYCDSPQAYPSPFRFILHGVVIGLLALFGIVANGAIIRVLSKPSMRCPTALILVALAVMDTVALAVALAWIGEAWAEFLRWRWLHNAWLACMAATHALGQAATLAGVCTTLLAACERAVCSLCPDSGRRLCRTAFALVGVALVALFSLAFGTVKLFELAVGRAEGCAESDWNAYRLELTALGSSSAYRLFQLTVAPVVTLLWPYFLVAATLALIAVGFRTGRRRPYGRPADAHCPSGQYERMVAGVAVLFLLLRLPNVALLLVEWVASEQFFYDNADAYTIAADMCALLTLICAAVKLPIYVALSPMFRRVLLNKGETHGVAMVDMWMDEKAAYPEDQGGDTIDEKTILHNVQ